MAAGGAAIAGSSPFCAYLFRSRAIGRVLLPVLTTRQAGYIDGDLAGSWSGGMKINIKHQGPHGLGRWPRNQRACLKPVDYGVR